MISNSYTLNVDLKQRMSNVIPKFVQFDSAELVFNIYDGGKPYDMSQINSAIITSKSPNGKVVSGDAVIETVDGQKVIRYSYLGTEMEQTGKHDTSLTMFTADGKKKITIMPFTVEIVTDLTIETTESAKQDYNALQTMLIETQDIVNNVKNTENKKNYNATIQYYKNNIVEFNGSSYQALKDIKGVAPTGNPTDANWSLLSRKGADGTGTVVRHREEFISSEGQDTFTLKNTYDQFQNRIDVTVGNVPQFSPDNFTEATNTSIKLNEPLPAGVKVVVTYFSEAQPLKTDLETVVNNHTTNLNENNATISSLSTQLAEKANDRDVIKKSEGVGLDEAKPDLLAAIQNKEGETTFNLLSIPRPGSVTPGTTTFFKLSKNLFNKSTTVPGHVSGDTGQVLDSASYVTSDFILVKENATYTLSRGYRYAFYNSDKTYLSGGNLIGAINASVTVPAGAVYIRFGINTGHISPDVYMFVEGSTMPQTYEAYGQDIIPRERQEKQIGLIRDNLGDVFSLGADLASGTDLNTVTREGFFTGDGSRTYTNLPADHPTNRAFSLQVIPLYRGGNRWFLQKLTDFTQPFRKYVRKLDKNGSGTTAWVEDTVPNTKVDLVNGENLDNVIKEGNYLGVNSRTYLNLPPQMVGKSFFLDVNAYGYTSQNFIVQHIRDFFDEMVVYVRTVKNGTASSWKQLSLTSESKPLSGMIGVSFGDSITEFGNYPDVISQRTGAQFHNVGFGGCRMAHHTSQYYNPFSMTKLADAIVSGDFSLQQAQVDDPNNPFSNNFKANFERLKGINFTTVDYITIFYGTNDYAGTSLGTVPLGESGDYGDSTFKGAINYVVDKLMTAFPQLKIAFITPMWRENPTSLSGGESDTTPNTDGVFLVEYADAVIERANAHHLPALDMYRTGGINKYNRDKFLTDRVHPNAYGYTHVGNKIGAFLTSTF